jgi:hypothetical protein
MWVNIMLSFCFKIRVNSVNRFYVVGVF